jgi:hypothetical protein
MKMILGRFENNLHISSNKKTDWQQYDNMVSIRDKYYVLIIHIVILLSILSMLLQLSIVKKHKQKSTVEKLAPKSFKKDDYIIRSGPKTYFFSLI